MMEYTAVALNPAQGLIGGARLADLLSATGGHEATLRLFAAELDALPWAVYEVRRAILPRVGDPARLGRAARSLRAVARGTRAAMAAELRRTATRLGTRAEAGDGIERVWLRRRGGFLPAAEWYYVAAPAGPADKEGPGFVAAWRAALAGPVQLDLLDPQITSMQF